jgi:hypothetical protein
MPTPLPGAEDYRAVRSGTGAAGPERRDHGFGPPPLHRVRGNVAPWYVHHDDRVDVTGRRPRCGVCPVHLEAAEGRCTWPDRQPVRQCERLSFLIARVAGSVRDPAAGPAPGRCRPLVGFPLGASERPYGVGGTCSCRGRWPLPDAGQRGRFQEERQPPTPPPCPTPSPPTSTHAPWKGSWRSPSRTAPYAASPAATAA